MTNLRCFNYILLIDDDSDEHSMFKEALEKYRRDIKYTAVYTCEQGYDKAKQSKPDVIFLDMNLPGTNGLACLRKFKRTELLKDVPVYIYSCGDVTKNEITIALEEGACKWIKNPDDFEGYTRIFSSVLN